MPDPPPPPTSFLSSPYIRSLIAGGFAGMTVDLSLFPLDTLKTRLQSSRGFFTSGGFSGIYKGVGSVVAGSAPGAALFFVTYEGVKNMAKESRRAAGGPGDTAREGVEGPGTHMLAASLGEIAACAVRVPTEVVKQRAQAGQHSSSLKALRAILGSGGVGRVWAELYRGWGVTIMREVPFTVIQFPLWEWGKRVRAAQKGAERVNAAESGLIGSVAGAVAAASTTPLDVVKTRLMLAEEKQGAWAVGREIVRKEGAGKLFSGIVPRVFWISIGGAIFLGAFDFAKGRLDSAGEREEKR